jgi:hypothetical protein
MEKNLVNGLTPDAQVSVKIQGNILTTLSEKRSPEYRYKTLFWSTWKRGNYESSKIPCQIEKPNLKQFWKNIAGNKNTPGLEISGSRHTVVMSGTFCSKATIQTSCKSCIVGRMAIVFVWNFRPVPQNHLFDALQWGKWPAGAACAEKANQGGTSQAIQPHKLLNLKWERQNQAEVVETVVENHTINFGRWLFQQYRDMFSDITDDAPFNRQISRDWSIYDLLHPKKNLTQVHLQIRDARAELKISSVELNTHHSSKSKSFSEHARTRCCWGDGCWR